MDFAMSVFNKISSLLVLLLLLGLSQLTMAVDLPECDFIPFKSGQYIVGLSEKGDANFQKSIVMQGLLYEDVVFCREDSHQALNQYTPWGKHANLERYYGWGVFGISFVISLFAFSLLPKRMRSDITVLGLLFIGGVTWLIATTSLMLLNKENIPQKYFYDNLVRFDKAGMDSEQWVDITSLRDFGNHLRNNSVPLKKQFDNFMIKLVSADFAKVKARIENPDSEVDAIEQPVVSRIPLVRYKVLQQKYKNQRRVVNVVKVDGNGTQLDEPKWIRAEDIDFEVENTDFKGKIFVPRQALNICSGPSIKYKKIKKVLTISTEVTATGKHFGDWWEVLINGSKVKGWVNSLWLVPSTSELTTNID